MFLKTKTLQKRKATSSQVFGASRCTKTESADSIIRKKDTAFQTGDFDGVAWSDITEDYLVSWADVTNDFLTHNTLTESPDGPKLGLSSELVLVRQSIVAGQSWPSVSFWLALLSIFWKIGIIAGAGKLVPALNMKPANLPLIENRKWLHFFPSMI